MCSYRIETGFIKDNKTADGTIFTSRITSCQTRITCSKVHNSKSSQVWKKTVCQLTQVLIKTQSNDPFKTLNLKYEICIGVKANLSIH